MEFSDEALDSFIEAWKNDFDETLSRDQAQLEASRVMETCDNLLTLSLLKRHLIAGQNAALSALSCAGNLKAS